MLPTRACPIRACVRLPRQLTTRRCVFTGVTVMVVTWAVINKPLHFKNFQTQIDVPLLKDVLGDVDNATFVTDIGPLMKKLVDHNSRQSYAWIRGRISRMWPRWTNAAEGLQNSPGFSVKKRQKILLHLGLLSTSGLNIAKFQFKGGPLGELVQWSDLISTLYILGHELTITSEIRELAQFFRFLVTAPMSPCQSHMPVNIIYTDIVGLNQFKSIHKAGYTKYSCLFRVLDSFGTEPAFNHLVYAKAFKLQSPWGGQNLNPRQFFTMFPHSPDNSFMGFVVDQTFKRSLDTKKEEIAVVYGKKADMWKDKRLLLDIVHSRLEVHGTVYSEVRNQSLPNVPDYVINHGILSGLELQKLLEKAKVFVGLGFPYEGPAPLEAVANGAVFLNPLFDPPHSSKNTPFFKGKPTSRQLTSQHPYAERFIGKPFVYTVNMNHNGSILEALDEILTRNKFDSYLPYEYTAAGMLQRMNAYIKNQNFCFRNTDSERWPPQESIEIVMGDEGESCVETCWRKGRLCERDYFSDINQEKIIKNFTKCNRTHEWADIYFPSVHTQSQMCRLQMDHLLFSCVGGMTGNRRLCPCRDFMKGQSSLCASCG